jgi:hypothetical protein
MSGGMKHFFQRRGVMLLACLSAGACAAGSPESWFGWDDPAPGDASVPDASREESGPPREEPDSGAAPEASALVDGSCQARCASTSAQGGCYCDPACAVHQDCCGDYASACTTPDGAPPPPVSCTGRCGAAAPPAGCACDPGCKSSGTCCADFASACPPPDAGSPHVGSCVAQCGVKGPSGQCHCDPSCVTYADCCADYAAVCGDGG